MDAIAQPHSVASPAGNDTVPTKILIIRFSSIGDIVLTTPVVRCLKKQMPDVEIHYLTKQSFKSILEANPYIDKMHLLGDDLDATIEQLKKECFNYIIDLHHNVRTLRVKQALKTTAFSFNKLNLRKWLFTALKVNSMPAVHIVDRYMETVRLLGVLNDGKGLDYFIPDSQVVSDNDIPLSHAFGYIGVVIGAALPTKQMPVHKLKALCNSINYPVILLGGPEDQLNGDAIAADDPVRIYNSCGKFSLNESADLVRRAKLIVTHDTGLMHIAAAFKKPIISIWGNTHPAFGMGPYYGLNSQPSNIMEVKGLWCRPCSKIGYNKCPLGHFNCMEKQDLQEIAAIINMRIGRQ